TALGRQSPRPAARVSAACSSGESSSPTAAATPPWARKLVDESSGPFESRTTSASTAAQTAANNPATPPPTMTRSVVVSFTLLVFDSESITYAAVYQASSHPGHARCRAPGPRGPAQGPAPGV